LKYQQGPLQFEINRRKQVLYLANSENGQRQQLSVSITSKSILNPQSHFAFIKKIGAVEEVQSQALNGRGRPERTRYAFNEKVNQMQAVDYDFCHESVLSN
jgi:hypothetical protein